MSSIQSRNALTEAWNIQRSAAERGFDWPDISGPLAKVVEETDEIRHALAADDMEHAREELGDLLFSAVNLARFLDIDPNDALATSTNRFQRRFAAVVARVCESKREPEACSLDELDRIWEQIKQSSEGSRGPLDTGGENDAHSPPT